MATDQATTRTRTPQSRPAAHRPVRLPRGRPRPLRRLHRLALPVALPGRHLPAAGRPVLGTVTTSVRPVDQECQAGTYQPTRPRSPACRRTPATTRTRTPRYRIDSGTTSRSPASGLPRGRPRPPRRLHRVALPVALPGRHLPAAGRPVLVRGRLRRPLRPIHRPDRPDPLPGRSAGRGLGLPCRRTPATTRTRTPRCRRMPRTTSRSPASPPASRPTPATTSTPPPRPPSRPARPDLPAAGRPVLVRRRSPGHYVGQAGSTYPCPLWHLPAGRRSHLMPGLRSGASRAEPRPVHCIPHISTELRPVDVPGCPARIIHYPECICVCYALLGGDISALEWPNRLYVIGCRVLRRSSRLMCSYNPFGGSMALVQQEMLQIPISSARVPFAAGTE